MKKNNLNLIFMTLIAGLLMSSCEDNKQDHHNGIGHGHVIHQNGDSTARNLESKSNEQKGDLTQIFNNYFVMNEQLVIDNSSSASISAEKLVTSLKVFNAEGITKDEQKRVNEILESAIENAEHISSNAKDIHHQREHLVSLSIDLKDLVLIIGLSQKLYEVYCPMADNNKGAIWISNKNEIQNPFMGSSMPKCGKVNRIIE